MQRFWDKVNKTETCWLWTAGCTRDGYGLFAVQSSNIKTAHRYSLILATGIDPPDKDCSHLCFNRGCVNPAHLTWETHSENMQRVRFYRRSDVRGERNPQACLTEADVLSIRASTEPCQKLAKGYGVTASAIYDARTRRTWKHI